MSGRGKFRQATKPPQVPDPIPINHPFYDKDDYTIYVEQNEISSRKEQIRGEHLFYSTPGALVAR
jgi:hypothetical protein